MIAFNKINSVVLERRILTTTIEEMEQKILHTLLISFLRSWLLFTLDVIYHLENIAEIRLETRYKTQKNNLKRRELTSRDLHALLLHELYCHNESTTRKTGELPFVAPPSASKPIKSILEVIYCEEIISYVKLRTDFYRRFLTQELRKVSIQSLMIV